MKNISEKKKEDSNKPNKKIIIFLDGLVGPGGIDEEIDQEIGAKKVQLIYLKNIILNFILMRILFIMSQLIIPSVLNFDHNTKYSFNPKIDGAKIMLDKKYMKASFLYKDSTYVINKNKF